MRRQIAFPHPRRQRRIGFVERGVEQPQIQIRKFGRPITLKINHAHGSSPNVSPGRRANWHRASPREVTNRKECAMDWPGFLVRIMISRRRLRGIARPIGVAIVRDFFVSQDFNRAGNIVAKTRCGCRMMITRPIDTADGSGKPWSGNPGKARQHPPVPALQHWREGKAALTAHPNPLDVIYNIQDIRCRKKCWGAETPPVGS